MTILSSALRGDAAPSILAINPGHDGTFAFIENASLQFSIEAEKNSFPRFSTAGPELLFEAAQYTEAFPDVLAISGWREDSIRGDHDYFGTADSLISCVPARFFGKSGTLFKTTHERSHIFCSYGLSPFEQGIPCYALVWEGEIGRFYEIDEHLRIQRTDQVLPSPGYKYSFLFQLADPRQSVAGWNHHVAGKLMALAAYSTRGPKTEEEKEVIEKVLKGVNPPITEKGPFAGSPFHNCLVTNPHFMEMAGKFSDTLFEQFHNFASEHLTKGYPLLISGGCGLNCEWNSRWLESGLFSDVFVPPVTNDSGCAIGAAIDAQFHLSGKAKVSWTVYSGLEFDFVGSCDHFDEFDLDLDNVADLLAQDKIIAWVQGRYEIGPRALGNRSLLAAPFKDETRKRLNEMKQREYYRPVAPVCLEEDLQQHFSLTKASPHMLYFCKTLSPELRAVTHVDGTARPQTVSYDDNPILCDLLKAFKKRTGYGVLCNTSLNFPGRGFINRFSDLVRLIRATHIDGAVVGNRLYVLKSTQA